MKWSLEESDLLLKLGKDEKRPGVLQIIRPQNNYQSTRYLLRNLATLHPMSLRVIHILKLS
jgi:hypothetical protein